MQTQAEDQTILVLNSGSSSLKFGLFRRADGDEALLLSGSAEGIGRDDGSLRIKVSDGRVLEQQEPVLESQTDVLQKLSKVLVEQSNVQPAAVGHRVVHGGPHLRTHQLLTAGVRRQLQDAVHFAPLHIPPALALIDEASAIFSEAQHFACFDTAFHATLQPLAAQFPLSRRYAEAGVIRYGFHGLSYESLVTQLGTGLPSRAVFAHLGNGSSVCALRDGKSVDTSMGTRSGDLDPGVLLYLMRSEKLDASALETLLNRKSGLAGYTDGESDMQALEKRAKAGDANAALALDVFATSVRKTIGAYAALLGGIDLLVFTGGIGEHSAEIRRRVCDGLAFLELSENDPAGKVRAIHTEEEKQIARHCRALLHQDAGKA
ncbi:MAG: Acetate kinase (EC [uncultured Paraburkholderia sp.]|nr:MAG: Acetate kinase (EC [uncultured Paraburkholderia sp.]CAH2935328.1 MAG: Acetate kinase (EC [uncultured Paraburkholderia sp.]